MKVAKSAIAVLAALAVGPVVANAADHGASRLHDAGIRHVLLLSIDGLHALDVARMVETKPGSAMAELARHGVTYSNASTPADTDSFPGLLALVTGGSPVSHGVFYDVSYDRTFYDPANTSCSGPAGNVVVYDESVDNYSASNVSLDTLDPAKLPRRIDARGNCVPVYPHSFVRTNTIFEVVKAHRGLTAWADKHPTYDLVNGPSGHGVDDLYTPEITNVGGFNATVSVACTVDNDRLKVRAILNQIQGKAHDGTPASGVPAVFGMNFQAVSVGQKIAKDNAKNQCPQAGALTGKAGGYLDAYGTPGEVLAYGLNKTDEALGSIIKALEDQGIYRSTLIIVTAKHGQSPIDPRKSNKPGHFADLVAALPDATTSNPAAVALATAAGCSSGPCGLVQDDDVAFIWLPDQSQTKLVADYLNANAKALFIDQVFAGRSLKLKFNDPLTDSRTPDLIVQPVYGTIYTSSSKKNAEHGGFSFGDTNVGLIVSHPGLAPRTIKTPVASSQVAPTILEALGLEAEELEAVRVEHTPVLPGLGRGDDD